MGWFRSAWSAPLELPCVLQITVSGVLPLTVQGLHLGAPHCVPCRLPAVRYRYRFKFCSFRVYYRCHLQSTAGSTRSGWDWRCLPAELPAWVRSACPPLPPYHHHCHFSIHSILPGWVQILECHCRLCLPASTCHHHLPVMEVPHALHLELHCSMFILSILECRCHSACLPRSATLLGAWVQIHLSGLHHSDFLEVILPFDFLPHFWRRRLFCYHHLPVSHCLPPLCTILPAPPFCDYSGYMFWAVHYRWRFVLPFLPFDRSTTFTMGGGNSFHIFSATSVPGTWADPPRSTISGVPFLPTTSVCITTSTCSVTCLPAVSGSTVVHCDHRCRWAITFWVWSSGLCSAVGYLQNTCTACHWVWVPYLPASFLGGAGTTTLPP